MILAAIALGATAGAAIELSRPQEHEATARALHRAEPVRSELARDPRVARAALARAGARPLAADALLEHSEVEPEDGGGLAFRVRADGPRAARRLASAYARAYVAAVPRSRRARVRAVPAGAAESTRSVEAAALLGAGLGLAVGLLLALAREALDVRRISSRRVARRLRKRQLGTVPGPPRAPERAHALVSLDDPASEAAGSYSELAGAVLAAAAEAEAHTLLVAGTVAQDGGPVVAANLGVQLARRGRDVVVVDLDLSDARLRRLFALERGPGLAGVLSGERPVDRVLAEVPLPGGGPGSLRVLAAGEAPSADERAAAEVLKALRERCELTIVAAPPLLGAAGVEQIARAADALIVVTHLREVRHSRRPQLERRLARLDCPTLGFVLAGAGEEPDAERLSGPRARTTG